MESIGYLYRGVQWFNCIFEPREQPKFLLDPLTTIVKIAMLKYRESKTKIYIYNNNIFYSEPNYLQGVNRWVKGASRNDLNHLFLPILYFCYLKHQCKQTESSCTIQIPSNFRSVVDQLNDLVLDGIQALKNTYVNNQSDLVINCLDLYALMLSSETEPEIKKKYDKINVTSKNTYEEFLKCWKPENIELVKKLFDELETGHQDMYFVNKSLDILDTYLDAINHNINHLREP